jgi:protein-tyrosine phosphatase
MTQLPKPPSQLNRILSLLRIGPKGVILRFVDQGIRKITGTPYWHLSRVTPQLYVGGQHTKWGGMAQEGITAVVNMREAKYDDVAIGVAGEAHLHLPTRDNTPPTLEDLQRGADFIAAQIQQGSKVYVHCGVGVGRAPTMAAAYLIKHEQLSPKHALQKIRTVRPFIHLTSKQRHCLNEFAQQVQQVAAPTEPEKVLS